MSDELKPCPFDGSLDVVVKTDRALYWVTCKFCGCEGPLFDVESEAITAWNLRPVTPTEEKEA